MEIDKYEMPDDLYYHSEHCWARKEGDIIVVGVNDFAQKLAGTIKRVVTLDEEDEVSQGKPFGTLSSGKWTGKLYSPISGEITELNEELEDEPNMINNDPYGDGWMIKIEAENLDEELGNLMKGGSEELKGWLLKEIEKNKQE